jgi:hypothetical protein
MGSSVFQQVRLAKNLHKRRFIVQMNNRVVHLNNEFEAKMRFRLFDGATYQARLHPKVMPSRHEYALGPENVTKVSSRSLLGAESQCKHRQNETHRSSDLRGRRRNYRQWRISLERLPLKHLRRRQNLRTSRHDQTLFQ